MEDLTNIWNAGDELNDDELLNYVKGRSTPDDAYSVEKKMADSSFLNDGVEGLQHFSSEEKINAYVQQINTSLHQKLHEKKVKHRKGITGFSWEIIAVIAVILLCLLGFIIIEMMHK